VCVSCGSRTSCPLERPARACLVREGSERAAHAGGQDVRAPQTKPRPTQLNRPRFLPLVLSSTPTMTAWSVYIGLRAADRSCEAPPSLVKPSISSPCLFGSSTVLATPFPRKSRHRSDVKCLPQSTSQPLSPSLTLIAFFPFAFCRSKHQQRLCQRLESDMPQANFFGFPIRFEPGVRGLAWKINESGVEAKRTCSSSIQRSCNYELKSLAPGTEPLPGDLEETAAGFKLRPNGAGERFSVNALSDPQKFSGRKGRA
jgi:hypothetical protein